MGKHSVQSHGGGHEPLGAHARESHEQHTATAAAHDHDAGLLRSKGYSASGVVLTKINKSTRQSEKFYELQVRGPDVLLHWGPSGTQGKSETKRFPDALMAEQYALDTVEEHIKEGWEVDSTETQSAKSEGVPRFLGT